jgi:cellulose biosynthesis protein BcsQ
MEDEAMGAAVAMVNQKGGVGKTTVTLGLAASAQVGGHRVLVVDLDPQGSATWVLGLDPAAAETSTAEVLDASGSAAASTARKAITTSRWGEGVDVIPASERLHRWEQAGARDATRLRTGLIAVAAGYDAVLVDCPPSLGHLTSSALSAADLALIVVEPAALGLRGISAVADRIDEIWEADNPDLDLAGVVVNRVPGVSTEAERRIDELGKVVGRRAVWHPYVPQRVIASQAVSERRPIHHYGYRAADLSAAFDALWAKLRRRVRAAA